MIPCLNTHPLWVKTIADWIEAIKLEKQEMILV
jgi:protoheme ferro-lyase